MLASQQETPRDKPVVSLEAQGLSEFRLIPSVQRSGRFQAVPPIFFTAPGDSQAVIDSHVKFSYIIFAGIL